jgi:hypothetical protein
MRLDREDFTVEHAEGRSTLRGVLRLPSPEAYDPTFAPIRAAVAADAAAYTLDVADVTFMNSSGIRALADIVLAARNAGRPFRLVGSSAVPWQKKTMTSLKALHDGLEVELAG